MRLSEFPNKAKSLPECDYLRRYFCKRWQRLDATGPWYQLHLTPDEMERDDWELGPARYAPPSGHHIKQVAGGSIIPTGNNIKEIAGYVLRLECVAKEVQAFLGSIRVDRAVSVSALRKHTYSLSESLTNAGFPTE